MHPFLTHLVPLVCPQEHAVQSMGQAPPQMQQFRWMICGGMFYCALWVEVVMVLVIDSGLESWI